MEWTENLDGDVAVVTLRGEIDLNHSPKLRSFFQSKIQAKLNKLLLDFTEVKYIDSSGLATLVEYYQGSRSFSGKIALASLSPRVKSVFELVRLSEIFQIYTSVDEAKAALNS
jgi:anti-sigma B factor antagonist